MHLAFVQAAQTVLQCMRQWFATPEPPPEGVEHWSPMARCVKVWKVIDMQDIVT